MDKRMASLPAAFECSALPLLPCRSRWLVRPNC